MQLVTVKDNQVFCDSSMIAKKFGIKHNQVIKVCDGLIEDIAKIKGSLKHPLIKKEIREYRGAEFTAYIMDRNFFSLLCMRFKGKSALEWQMKFNDAFYKMESALIESSKPSELTEKMNANVKQFELDKMTASDHGRGLAAYCSKKRENACEYKKLVEEVQLSLGFEE